MVSQRFPKFVLNNDLEAISFNTKDKDKEFDTMIGHLKADNYHKGKLSFVIEDLVHN